MKKFARSLLTVSAFTLLAGSLAGCGGGKHYDVTITFWHTMGEKLRTQLDTFIDEFHKIYPEIGIKHASQGGYPELEEKISAAIPAGTTPTMAYCYPDHVAEYMVSNAVIDMTPYVEGEETKYTEEDGLQEDIIDMYWQEGQQYATSGIYSVPYSKSTEIMFYNKDIFDDVAHHASGQAYQVPTTWEQMEVLMKEIKTDYPTLIPLGYDSDANMFITLCEQYGIPYTSIKDGKGSIDFNNTAAKAMATKVIDWINKGYLVTQETSNGAYTSTQFKEGTLVMTIGSTGGAGYNYSKNFTIESAPVCKPDAEHPFDFGGTLPNKGNDHIIMQGPSICFFRKSTQEQKDAAWKFYKFITRTLYSAAFSTKSGYSPIRESSFTCEPMVNYLNSKQTGEDILVQKCVKAYGELTERYYVSPAFHGSSVARAQVNGIFATVSSGEKTLDTAFAEAYAKAVFATK